MQIVKPVAIAVLLVSLCSNPAHADSSASVGRSFDQDAFDARAHRDGTNTPPSSLPTPTTKHGTGKPARQIDHIDCTTIIPGEPITPQMRKDCAVPTPILGGKRPAQPPRAQLAAQYAIDYFKSVELPAPRPKMSSPDGVCGAIHYLDLQVPSEVVFKDPQTNFGPLVMHMNANFDIDWGDGQHLTTTSSGSPGITSKLSHFWINEGSYTIKTTAHWSASWSFGEYSGVITGPTTTGTQDNWQVVELQAVITG